MVILITGASFGWRWRVVYDNYIASGEEASLAECFAKIDALGVRHLSVSVKDNVIQLRNKEDLPPED
jgi:hypothetical protein